MKTKNIYTDYCAFCGLLEPQDELNVDSVKFEDCVSCYTSLLKDIAQVDILEKYRRK